MARAGPVSFQVLGLQMYCMLLTYYVGSKDPSSDLLVSSKPSPQPYTSCIAETDFCLLPSPPECWGYVIIIGVQHYFGFVRY